MQIPILNDSEVIKKINSQHNPFFEEYFAFFSTWFGGIIKNPHLMLVPIDDHMVHRGDGVFEAMKAVNKSVYLMDEHLQRLLTSAEKISLKSPYSLTQIKDIALQTFHAADRDDAIIRIFLSRGPGSFSVNPYDSIAPQLYIVVTQLKSPAASAYENGVVIGKSEIPVKSSWIAQVKSCNYLPNVLMKKEAVDRQLDYVVSVDSKGYIAECATENIMMVDQSGVITYPELDNILKGTTMIRACELAEKNGIATVSKPISMEDLISAKEVILAGTTINILPVVKVENHQIGDGRPGMIAKKLHELIWMDIRKGFDTHQS